MTELSFLEELFLELSKALLTLALEGFSITSLPPIQSLGYLKALANHTISTRDYHGSPLQPMASCTTPEKDILLCTALPSHSLPQCLFTASAIAFFKERAYSAALCIEITLRENSR